MVRRWTSGGISSVPPIPTRKPPLPWSQLPPGRSATTCWVLRTLGFGEEYRGNILFKHTAGISSVCIRAQVPEGPRGHTVG